MIRNVDPALSRNHDPKIVTYPYCCRRCDSQFWWNYHDLLRVTNTATIPCGCPWSELAYDWRRDPSTSATPSPEEAPHHVSV